MKYSVRILILLLVTATAAGILALKVNTSGTPQPDPPDAASEPADSLPRLVDLGAGKCIPCKAMKPILDDLMANHAHQFSTTFIDVWENPEAGKAHGVRMIPTQIFYDAEGAELIRHEGFLSREDIFKIWQELGYTFPSEGASI